MDDSLSAGIVTFKVLSHTSPSNYFYSEDHFWSVLTLVSISNSMGYYVQDDELNL